ncbi:hypothetical protein NicSoilB8_19620 [Arthrobacter sp. NicSoilB8]|nr:hypothetical protein NicSoilB8_19620 [Arthrobacter sp. NicSoilB8]
MNAGFTPTPYPIPPDGPVGKMLEATGRSPMRASHLHFMVTATRLRTLVTHIFVRGDEQVEHDTVFGVKDSLIKDFETQLKGTPTPMSGGSKVSGLEPASISSSLQKSPERPRRWRSPGTSRLATIRDFTRSG